MAHDSKTKSVENDDDEFLRNDDKWWTSWQLWVGVALGVVAVVVAAMVILSTSDDDPLTDRESLLFTVVVAVFTVLASMLISSYFSRRQARSEYQSLARPAWRRVAQLNQSVSRLMETIAVREQRAEKLDTVGSETVVEWLESIRLLVREHSGQLEDAISDWDELLPADSRTYQELLLLRDERDQRSRELRAVRATSEDASQQIDKLRAEVDRLDSQMRTKGLSLGGLTIGSNSVTSYTPTIDWANANLSSIDLSDLNAMSSDRLIINDDGSVHLRAPSDGQDTSNARIVDALTAEASENDGED